MTTGALMAVLGGVGLFLLGMRLMTDGLRMAAGNALRDILASWTRTPLRGLTTGFGITAAVQSSSAVTVAVIGFANAGLLTLSETLWVIYGSNVGTSITGWLVALVGFKINLKALALPFVGVGMVLNISGHGGSRRAAVGEALAGFGLFFMGVDVLKDGFAGLGDSFDPATMGGDGLLCVVIFLAIGMAMTILMQSSSASMAMLITAAASGAIPISCAAAAVVGANVGTTATAALTVIGASPNAKRVAGGHIIFNLLAGAAALILLPVLTKIALWVAGLISSAESPSPALTLALFHTGINIGGVLVVGPLTGRITTFLSGRFRTTEEELGQPAFIDHAASSAPTLALESLKLELGRMGAIAREMATAYLRDHTQDSRWYSQRADALARLETVISDFIHRIQRLNLNEATAAALVAALRVAVYYRVAGEAVAEGLEDISQRSTPSAHETKEDETEGDAVALASNASSHPCMQEVRTREAAYVAHALEAIDNAVTCRPHFDATACMQSYTTLTGMYSGLKDALLQAGVSGCVDATELSARLEHARAVRRAVEQTVKGAVWLAKLPDASTGCPGE